MNKQVDFPIADVQSTQDTRLIAIDRVGIKAIRHPVKVADKSGGVQHTIAVFNMYVNLTHKLQGQPTCHVSWKYSIAKNVKFLWNHSKSILRAMVKKLGTNSGHIEMTFPYFINKSAPVSGVKSLLDYEVTFIGEIKNSGYEFTNEGDCTGS